MAVWRGQTDLEPGKVELDFQIDKTIGKTNYTGPYTTCLASRPAIGSSIEGIPSGITVTAAKVVELDGGAGRIDIELQGGGDSSPLSSDSIGDPIYENDWSEVVKAIETHPRCGTLKADRPYWKGGVSAADASQGGKQRTWEDWADLTDDDYDDNGGADDTWSLVEYKSLREKGTDSYRVYHPTIRRTTYHLARPNDLGDQSGQVTTPPSAANFTRISDYEWLGGADRCIKNRNVYQRTTEWDGAESISGLVYAGGGG